MANRATDRVVDSMEGCFETAPRTRLARLPSAICKVKQQDCTQRGREIYFPPGTLRDFPRASSNNRSFRIHLLVAASFIDEQPLVGQ